MIPSRRKESGARANGRRFTRRTLLAAALVAPGARALGRTPLGKELVLELPYSLDRLDPHTGDDAASALLASAVADPLFAWDAAGRPYPALAAGMPEAVADGARVALRPGLVTARGRALDARDVLFSLERARSRAGRPLLSAFGPPARVQGDPLAILVPGATPDALADALASPVTAIVPRAFDATHVDGTGAFAATLAKDSLVLVRNERAARGPAFLEGIRVRRARDLAGALRAFEAGEVDVGWLGAGLHQSRAGAVPLRAPSVAVIVLRTGPEAGGWGAPGVAQRLVEGLDAARFAHLGLVLPSAHGEGGWGGAPADLLVDGGSALLAEIGSIVSALLSRPGHEVRPLQLPNLELRRRREAGRYALAVDVVRKIGPAPLHLQGALLAAADPRLAERPPHLGSADAASVARTLPLAVVGELAVAGAVAPNVHGLQAWDLGGVWKDG